MPPDRPVIDLVARFDPDWLPTHLRVDRVRGQVGAASTGALVDYLDDLVACYRRTRPMLHAHARRMLGDGARAEEAVLAAMGAACRAGPTTGVPAWRSLAFAVDQEIARRLAASSSEEPDVDEAAGRPSPSSGTGPDEPRS